MKLKKCYLSSFGKLVDFTYDFTSGLNVINQENGWGKSTLSTFIKCMFYGLEDSKRGLSNERKKYKTWNTDKLMGGYVEFEFNGKEYRLSRSFGKKSSEDEITLYDLASMQDVSGDFDDLNDIGKSFFKVDASAFKSTIFFAQKDLGVEPNESLSACITPEYNLGEGCSVDNAIVALEEKAKEYKKGRGEGGYIFETKKRIIELDEKIEKTTTAIENYNVKKEELTKLEEEILLLENNLKDYALIKDLLTENEKQKVVEEQIAIKQAELDAQKQELDKLNATFKDKNVNNASVDEFVKNVKTLNNTKLKEGNLEEEIAKFSSLINNEKDKQKSNFLSYLAFGVSAIFMLVSLICFIISQTIGGVILSALFVVSILIGVLLFNKKPAENVNKSNLLLEIEKDKKELERIKAIKEDVLAKIKSFVEMFDCFDLSFDDFEKLLRKGILEKEQLEIKVKQTEREIEQLKAKLVKIDLSLCKNETLDSATNKYNYFNRMTTEKKIELARIREIIKNFEGYIELLPQLDAERQALTEKLATLEEEYQIYTKASKLMSSANEELKKKYRKPLEDNLNKYLQLVTNNHFNRVSVDIDLNVFVEDGGVLLDSAYFSEGFKNLFSICERFALIDLLFDEEKPFIILDDPFTNLDKNKLTEALSLIGELAKSFQIIYFVCHESRV